MIYLLAALCAVLALFNFIFLIKIAGYRKAADEICEEMEARIGIDTNVGIDISISDHKMRRLAAEIDMQMKIIRKEQIRYLQGDKELKEAVTNISHDLRTPLTAVCGYMELLEREETSEKVREYLGVIQERIHRLKQLTEELFRYSLIVSVHHYEEREKVSLNQALEECIAAYYGALKEKGIIPEIKIPEKKMERLLNKAAFSRVLENIIGNALKYSDGDLKILLTEEGKVVFRNRAEEMNEVLAEKLFDRYYTVESGNNATGLGLSIARILTEEMGGRMGAVFEKGELEIWVEFDSPK